MPTQRYRVRGLAHADEARIEREVRRIPGVLFAAASHQDECAEVEFDDDRVGHLEIRDAIAALGFAVEIAG